MDSAGRLSRVKAFCKELYDMCSIFIDPQPYKSSELKEECGLSGKNLKKIGILEFEFVGEETILEVHVYETYKYCGEVMESEEMHPKWYDLKNIPFKEMWPDDAYWFPYMTRGQLFKGYFLYQGQDLILKHNIQSVEELPVDYAS
ncbi:hypothetical protein KM043_017117 [Ampulex compressa]|nr:hypothetical protein KM043_017117 [Ampulex compressa]